MSKLYKKFKIKIFFLLILGLLFSGLYFWYNQGGIVLAEESKPLNCKKQQTIDLPFGATFELGPNELELPIGKAIDETQETAKIINQELLKIIDASQAEIDAATTTIEYAGECNVGNCTTSGCWKDEDEYCDPHPCEFYPDQTCWSLCPGKCNQPNCGGDACPHKTEMGIRVTEVKRQAGIIKTSFTVIDNLFTLRSNPRMGCWLDICLSVGDVQNPVCRTNIEKTLDRLEKARSGDYLGCNGKIRKPLGLDECVLRKGDEEAFLRGEKSGEILLSCKEALGLGLLGGNEIEKDCYGMTECTAKMEEDGTTLVNCPRAENYYCCE
ncbi:MAG: hypothetical protein Q7R53_01065 [bacterium]|nr:hypothetical protein [bacterium]